MNINLVEINNLRALYGLKEMNQLPAIHYPDSLMENDILDIPFDELDNEGLEDNLFNSIIDAQYESIAIYPEWIRFFPKNWNKEI